MGKRVIVMMDLFNPEIIVYNLIGIPRGTYKNIDIFVDVLCNWFQMIDKTTTFHSDILYIAKDLANDKKFIKMINDVFISEDEPIDRLKQIFDIINDRCMEPVIKRIYRIITDSFLMSGGITSLYHLSHHKIKELSAVELLDELEMIFDEEIYDIFNISIWEDYFNISIDEMIKKFNPKNILLWYYESIQKYSLAR